MSFQMVETGERSPVTVRFQKHTADTRWKDFNISRRENAKRRRIGDRWERIDSIG